ncbi:14566_t:CDS:2 [Entrophospora sp. SA101]|nr:14566_t:CDS:2 [Entrophospora sp. SA101]
MHSSFCELGYQINHCYNHVNTTCLSTQPNSLVNTTDTNKNTKCKNEEGNNSKKKLCKCGATIHSHISCSKCPLNKDNQLLPIVKSAILCVKDITYEEYSNQQQQRFIVMEAWSNTKPSSTFIYGAWSMGKR